jgi:hypothetical protein
MSADRDELRDELLAVTSARRELSDDDEKYLIEQFLTRLEHDIDLRIDARLAVRPAPPQRPGPRAHPAAIVPIALGIAIPLSAIAGATAGLAGIALTWVAILVVVYLSSR